MLEYRGVSSAAFQHTFQTQEWQERILAHTEWFGACCGAHMARHRGKLSAGRWFRRDPGNPAALCGHGSNSREALSQTDLDRFKKKGRGTIVPGPFSSLSCEPNLHFPHGDF